MTTMILILTMLLLLLLLLMMMMMALFSRDRYSEPNQLTEWGILDFVCITNNLSSLSRPIVILLHRRYIYIFLLCIVCTLCVQVY